MLVGWLHRVDQVQKAGVPTWSRLVEALRDPRVAQNGIASKIEAKHYNQNEHAVMHFSTHNLFCISAVDTSLIV